MRMKGLSQAAPLIGPSVRSPEIWYKRSTYHMGDPITIPVVTCSPLCLHPTCFYALPMAPWLCRSQTVSHPPLDHMQRSSDENLPQFSLAMHGNTNAQSQSAGQNIISSMQPDSNLHSESDRSFGETYHAPQYAE